MPQGKVNPNDGTQSFPSDKKHNPNLTLEDELHTKLNALCKISRLSKAVIIRQCIDWRYQMQVQILPLCSTGGRCYCPERHPPPQAAPHQHLVPQEKPT